jgi:hypothetical protein
MNLGAMTLKSQNDRPRNIQMKFHLAISPIQSSQVWIGLSEPQQQLVAMTVIQVCQALAYRCPQPTMHRDRRNP